MDGKQAITTEADSPLPPGMVVDEDSYDASDHSVALKPVGAACGLAYVDQLRIERDAARKVIEVMGRSILRNACTFCDWRGEEHPLAVDPDGTLTKAELAEHIKTCPKHPMRKLEDAIKKALAVLSAAPELNMDNYSVDQVEAVNDAATEAFKILRGQADGPEPEREPRQSRIHECCHGVGSPGLGGVAMDLSGVRGERRSAVLSKQLTIIGIDNGHDGGIAFLGEAVQVYAMPTIEFQAPPRAGKKHPRTVREYDEGAICSLLEGLGPDNAFAFIEEARAMSRFDPKLGRTVPQGAVSNFNIGLGFGILRGILAARLIPYQIVPPLAWQKALFSGMPKSKDTKAQSAVIVGRLFPGVDLRKSARCSIPHDGKCDALAIAEYGRRLRG